MCSHKINHARCSYLQNPDLETQGRQKILEIFIIVIVGIHLSDKYLVVI